MNRRSFIRNSGFALGSGAFIPALSVSGISGYSFDNWNDIRNQFDLESGWIHMSQMLFASHPAPVRDAIERHRRNFDKNPAMYLENNLMEMAGKVCNSASSYLEADPEEIALTDSTTMGLGILYTGLNLKEGDEILTTTHDHYSTEKSLEFASMKNHASIRRISLYDEVSGATAEKMISKLTGAVGPRTRIIAVTWVHSCTGMKLPIRRMSDAIRKINSTRDANNRIYFCVDGVHGFGIENTTMAELGCDFFAAGTHKWLFGPRGTGILWGKKDAWDMVIPTIPAFRQQPYGMYLGLVPEGKINFSEWCTPGGFHSYEYRWSLIEAFDFHMKIGKDKIEKRTRELNSLLKEELAKMDHVKLHTPVNPELSAGINCFEVNGYSPEQAVAKLHEKKIIASTSPYRTSYVRLTPCINNTEEEVLACISAVRDMKA